MKSLERRDRQYPRDFFSSFFGDSFGDLQRNFPMMMRQPEIPSIFGQESDHFPQLDLQEKEGQLTLTAELPGLEDKDVDIYLDNDDLVIEGEKKVETKTEEEGHMYRERRYGKFHRRIRLPYEVDARKVLAKFENGVLTVKLNQAEESKAKTRHIPITH